MDVPDLTAELCDFTLEFTYLDPGETSLCEELQMAAEHVHTINIEEDVDFNLRCQIFNEILSDYQALSEMKSTKAVDVQLTLPSTSCDTSERVIVKLICSKSTSNFVHLTFPSKVMLSMSEERFKEQFKNLCLSNNSCTLEDDEASLSIDTGSESDEDDSGKSSNESKDKDDDVHKGKTSPNKQSSSKKNESNKSNTEGTSSTKAGDSKNTDAQSSSKEKQSSHNAGQSKRNDEKTRKKRKPDNSSKDEKSDSDSSNSKKRSKKRRKSSDEAKAKDKKKDSDDEESRILEKRKQAAKRQRKRRGRMTESEKKEERKKAQMGMKRSRKKHRDNSKKKRASERRMLQRLEKRTGVPYNPEGSMDIDQHNFNCYLKSLNWFTCSKCHKKTMVSHYSKPKCGPQCELFTADNDMDPMPTPTELQNLTFIEKQLIARVHCVISLYKFRKCQYKYSGQVINFSQDVQSVADNLPHLVSDLDNVVVVKLSENITLQDFVVRRDVVLSALLWLKDNNPNYSDIKVNYENLDSLPLNGNVYSQLKQIDTDFEFPIDSEDKEDKSVETNTDHEGLDKEEIILTYTDVPDILDSSLKKSLENVLIWPSIGKTPVNEFSSPGFISLAFPYLFPYGKADFSMPRKHRVTLKDYIKHLMLYSDGRFSQDERFRYFIMNSEMRWTALNIGNIYVKKNSFFSKMTVVQLKEFLKKNPSVVNQVMHYGSRLRTTKSYWKSRCGELLDMVNQLGTPTVFFTLSSADFHWPDLYRLLGYDVKTLSIKERSDLLSKNPLVADSFFYARSKFFLEKAFKNHFNVTDIWYRYEYQHRGSIHVHGIAWFKDAPSITPDMTEEEKQVVIDYYNNIISCNNPDINIKPNLTHPCQLSLDEIDNFDDDLCQLINHVQRHTKCRKSHCLKLNSKTKKWECRYKFPKPMASETIIETKDGHVSDIVFCRNDALVNKFNSWVLQTWRSNIDMSPILTKGIVYKYIAKYAAKSEVKSDSYNEILTEILQKRCDDADPCKKAIRKLLLSSCSERDYCAQEIFHYLMGFKFYHCSRDFVVINLHSIDWLTLTTSLRSNNIIDLYAHRPKTMEYLSLFQLCKHYKVFKGVWHRRKVPSIVRYFPRPVKDKNEGKYYEVMAQYFYPWRSLDDIKIVDDVIIMFSEKLIKKYISYHNDDFEFEDNNTDSEDSNYNTNKKGAKDNESILSGFNPNLNQGRTDLKTCETYQWDKLANKLDIETVQVINEKLRTDFHRTDTTKYDANLLNRDQKKVFSFVKDLIGNMKSNTPIPPKFVLVQGMPGTGKTYVLKMCVQHIREELGDNAVKVVAPTGVAARIINGTTLHSFMSLGRYGVHAEQLTGLELLAYRQKNAGLKFLFVDEWSMVGLRMLSCLERRCKDLADSDSLFGGVIVFFFGDCNQLSPCLDQPLYAEIDSLQVSNALLERGLVIMGEVSEVFVLKICHRFANVDYIKFLKRVSKGKCTEDDVHKLEKRCINVVEKNGDNTFKTSMFITSTNERANHINKIKLTELNKPIACIKAVNNNRVAFLSSDDLADGLVNDLAISKGAKVMLRKNINISRGLVNGAVGVIRHIVYESGKKPPSLPMCVLIQFESVNLEDLSIKYVPLMPIQTTWYKNGVLCSRSQLPINLCWACTIHKAQGLSLISVILDAGSSEFALGLLYVALSRVSDFKDLCLLTSITLQRLNAVKKSSRYKVRRKFLSMLSRKSKQIM